MTGTLRAIVVPHAGYRYSGQVAAYAYRLLQNSKFKRIILVGPSHRPFRGVSVNLQWGYETPLGVVAVDTEVGKKIIRSHQEVRWIRQAHLYEHSLELQVPFLQTVLQGFRIVPILLGQQDLSTCTRLAQALTEVMEGDEHTLLLASTDLSHFYAYEDAKILDDRFIHHIKRLDPQGLAKDLGTGRCEGCGAGAVLTVMMAGKRRGADRAVILKYANSGDVTGDHRSVVGYVSAALIRSK
jgi:hypothetical protein